MGCAFVTHTYHIHSGTCVCVGGGQGGVFKELAHMAVELQIQKLWDGPAAWRPGKEGQGSQEAEVPRAEGTSALSLRPSADERRPTHRAEAVGFPPSTDSVPTH